MNGSSEDVKLEEFLLGQEVIKAIRKSKLSLKECIRIIRRDMTSLNKMHRDLCKIIEENK